MFKKQILFLIHLVVWGLVKECEFLFFLFCSKNVAINVGFN